MRGGVAFAVGFDFDDLSNEAFPTNPSDEILAEKIFSDSQGRTKIEGAGEFLEQRSKHAIVISRSGARGVTTMKSDSSARNQIAHLPPSSFGLRRACLVRFSGAGQPDNAVLAGRLRRFAPRNDIGAVTASRTL